jgi:transcriptional regulator with XRE-family HTH domain
VGLHGSNPVLQREKTHGKADELERVRRGRYCRQLREAAGISLQTMANRTFRDKSTLSRFENGKTTPADVGSLITQYEALGDPVAGATQRSSNATDAWIAGLWGSLALLALVAAVVPDDTGADVIRVGAIVAAIATLILTLRALRYRVISPWLGAAGLVIGGGSAVAVALRLGETSAGLRGGDGIVLLVSAVCALIWFKQDVAGRIQTKRADAKIAAADASTKVA